MQTYNRIDHPEIVHTIFQQNSTVPFTQPCPAGAEDIRFPVDPEIHLSCRFYPAAGGAPIILFFPSPSTPCDSYDALAAKYNEHGINILLMSYRGQMGNGGVPSVRQMLVDGDRLFEQAQDWLQKKGCTGSIFVMGHSLGSACAIETVLRNPDRVKGLIIESGICETAAFLQAIGVPAEYAVMDEEEGFDIIKKIEQIILPTLIFHGARDSLVSVAQAENLQSCSGAKSKQFFVIPGAERDRLPETGGDLYFQTIKKHIDTVCGVNTWRQRRKSFRNQGK